MESGLNLSKVVDNLLSQIAAQSQQIAVLQAIIQQIVPESEEINSDDSEPESSPDAKN
jgi:cell division protein FtsB